MSLLFFLSLIPFSTAWLGENQFATVPVALYAINQTLCGFAFYILQSSIKSHHKHTSDLIEALQKQQKKGIVSLFLYVISIIFAFIEPKISELLFVLVIVLWIIPDKNIENALGK